MAAQRIASLFVDLGQAVVQSLSVDRRRRLHPYGHVDSRLASSRMPCPLCHSVITLARHSLRICHPSICPASAMLRPPDIVNSSASLLILFVALCRINLPSSILLSAFLLLTSTRHLSAAIWAQGAHSTGGVRKSPDLPSGVFPARALAFGARWCLVTLVALLAESAWF